MNLYDDMMTLWWFSLAIKTHNFHQKRILLTKVKSHPQQGRIPVATCTPRAGNTEVISAQLCVVEAGK